MLKQILLCVIIRWKGGNTVSEQAKEIYIQLIDKVQRVSVQYLRNFCKLLDFNPELFNHIYNIQIKIGKTENNSPAQYLPDENYIIMNIKYIQGMLQCINKYSNDERKRISVILNMVLTLLHEMIHANRVIMIENGLNSTSIKRKSDDELLGYFQQRSGHDLNKYNMLLCNILGKSYVVEFTKYIPIKGRLNKDGSYTIIAYNCETKDYDEFANQHFNANIKDGIDLFLYQIGTELNNKDSNHKITGTIYSFINNDKQQKITIASDYYHSYSRNNKLVDKKDVSSSNVPTKEYAQILDKKTSQALDRIKNANGFEEIMTEVIANIIVITRNDKTLNLNFVINTIVNSNSFLPDEKVAAKFIQQMGVDMIKWFLISSYADCYNDYLEKIFQEKYDDLLHVFNNLYEATIHGRELDQFSVDNLNEIVKEKIGKNKQRKKLS